MTSASGLSPGEASEKREDGKKPPRTAPPSEAGAAAMNAPFSSRFQVLDQRLRAWAARGAAGAARRIAADKEAERRAGDRPGMSYLSSKIPPTAAKR
jgi:hypothetical protein